MIATLPDLSVEVAGTRLTMSEMQTLAEIRVQQRLSAPSVCEIIFRSSDVPAVNAKAPPVGSALRISIRGGTEALFAGEVTALEYDYGSAHGSEVRVRAYDLLHRLRKRQPVKAHVQVTTLDLARELAGGLGVSVQAAQPGPLWDRVLQYCQSDFELLCELASRSGQYLTLRGATLHLITLEGVGSSVALRLGEELLSARVEVNGDSACRSVSATGWDTARMQTHRGRAVSARSGRHVLAQAAPETLGGTGERTLIDEGAKDEAQADALAQAELDHRGAREVVLWGLANGNPALSPGTPVEVKGLRDEICGRYVLTSVNHLIDGEGGYVSEISTAPPPVREPYRNTTASAALVTAIDDPDGLGRVKVKLPTYGDLETGWIGVLSPGAGAGKGFMILPDVGDQVLVLFTHRDPALSVVLGGLYGAKAPPDAGLERGAIRRFTLLTPGGQRIRLDDGLKAIRIEDSKGSFVDFSPKKVVLHAEVDLTIEAPGKAIVIQGQTVDFRRV